MKFREKVPKRTYYHHILERLQHAELYPKLYETKNHMSLYLSVQEQSRSSAADEHTHTHTHTHILRESERQYYNGVTWTTAEALTHGSMHVTFCALQRKWKPLVCVCQFCNGMGRACCLNEEPYPPHYCN